ncbi:class I SAM-dependent DNA methyltransferase [Tepidimonas ignava]|uniref:class I SAM-dependent DNA methyltransferase n=1 Tax=Tepidimonas ignava TaxID=114249 RepID=UPI00391BED9E
MTPQAFIAKWAAGAAADALSERAGAQAHFIDLCRLLDVPEPADPDAYCFERGLKKTGGASGWADVWKRGCFAWEYKAPGRDLAAALRQLMTYALALDNPPLLIVSDRQRIEIHTHFTGAPSECHVFELKDLLDAGARQRLRWAWTEPERFRPSRTTQDVTAEAAARFAELARRLTARGHDPQAVAHFLIQCLFCLFAEDAGLLPGRLFERILERSAAAPEKLQQRLGELFAAMRSGGDFAMEDIAWFNGGLFEAIAPLPLDADDAAILRQAARMDWAQIEPSIFGTLFERGLDPAKRSQLGAHYTDPATIAKLIDPLIVQPLAAEWAQTRQTIAEAMARFEAGGKGSKTARQAAQAAFHGYLERLKAFRVLDPACGSGNFLYLALRALKDLEHRANLDAEALGLQRQLGIETSPANVLGIELNPYAAELARVTVWIGEIQWMLRHGYAIRRDPILARLEHIECRDALLNPDGSEADWPQADVIIGNPPFLGDKKMRSELGDAYTERLRETYAGRVPGGADLVTYWFEKARAQIEAGKASRAGLVATQAIRKGASRRVLDRIVEALPIFEAWSDEPWFNDGAAVRVSLVCFGRHDGPVRLDGREVAAIHADLTAGGSGVDLTTATLIKENVGVCFMGTSKVGAFDVPGALARQWLALPNPNGRPNADVVRPWANGQDLAGRPSDTWIIDFGVDMSEADAALYEAPFTHVQTFVRHERSSQKRDAYRLRWWIHAEARPGLRAAISLLTRYIATPRVAKHRFFVWLPVAVLPDSRLYAICREDDATFGVLSSRLHTAWALANASRHGDGDEGGRPTYNARDCFETFPFPEGLTPADTAHQRTETLQGGARIPADLAPAVRAHAEAIARAAHRLHTLREAWLNPPEWVQWQRTPEEEKAGFPPRPVARPGFEAQLKSRTLTNLYNQRPAWLAQAHAALDAAVAAAYGWADYTPETPDEEILARLLALNRARAGGQGG